MMLNGPFADAAHEFAVRGLAVLPLGGDDGKSPLIKFGSWKRPPTAGAVEKWIARFGSKNIGIACGPSNIVVVDCDDPKQAGDLEKMFGSTPFVVETPSGGCHLYYRNNGERCHNLRPDGLAADIKGIGGQVAAPPSIRPTGQHAGQIYRLVAGTFDDFARLPQVRPGSLPEAIAPRCDRRGIDNAASVIVGKRNNFLFDQAMQLARCVDDLEALIDALAGNNSALPQPLDHSEVVKIARSAWSYEERGLNWAGGTERPELTLAGLRDFARKPKALLLLTWLRVAHGARRGAPFAISAHAMETANVIPGWQARNYREERRNLEEMGYLVEVHHGGHGKGDPNFFAFASPEGGQISPPIDLHRPPRPSGSR